MQDDTIRELAKSASPQVRVVEYTKQGIKSMMEKRNVVAADRTPVHEFKDINGDWDKVAAAMFDLSDIREDEFDKADKADKSDKADKADKAANTQVADR